MTAIKPNMTLIQIESFQRAKRIKPFTSKVSVFNQNLLSLSLQLKLPDMKRLFLLFIAAAAVSCTSNQPKEAAKPSNVFVEQKVNEFVAQHPEWTSGETANEEITEKFKKEVIRWSNEEQFLNEMPMQFRGLRDTLLNGQGFKIATFTGYNDNTRPSGSVLNYIQLQIDGIVPNDLLKDLSKDKNYHLTGMLYKQGKRADVKVVKVADFKGYDLGKYTFSITKVKPL